MRRHHLPIACFLALSTAALAAPASATGEAAGWQLARANTPSTAPSVSAAHDAAHDLFYMPPASGTRLTVASNAYRVWTQALLGAAGNERDVEFWREFLGLGVPLHAAMIGAGDRAWELGEFERAIQAYRNAEELAPLPPQARARMGLALKETGYYEVSIAPLERAVSEKPDEPNWWVWYGDALRLTGQYETAQQAMEAAVLNAPGADALDYEPYVDFTLRLQSEEANWDNFMAHRDMALRHENYRRMYHANRAHWLSLVRQPEDPGEVDEAEARMRRAWTIRQLGYNYEYVNQEEAAAPYFRASAQGYAETEALLAKARSQNSMADVLRTLAERDGADRLLWLERAIAARQQATRLAREAEELAFERMLLGRLTSDLTARYGATAEETVDVREANRRETPMSGEIADFEIAGAVQGEADARFDEGDLAGARVLLERLQPFLEESTFLQDYERAAHNYARLADIYLYTDRPGPAITFVARGLAMLTRLRSFQDLDAYTRGRALQAYRRLNAAAAAGEIELGNFAGATARTDLYRTRLRRNLMGTRVDEDYTRRELAERQFLIARHEAFLAAELEGAEDPAEQALLSRLQTAAERDREEIAIAAALPPRIGGYEEIFSTDTPTLQAALPEDTLLLLYALGGRQSAVLGVTRDALHGAVLEDAGEDAVFEAVSAFTRAGQNGDDTAPALEELSQLLLAPMAEHLTTARVVVVPDGPLHYVPFAALPLEGAPLAERATVTYAASGSHLRHALEAPAGEVDGALALDRTGALGEAAWAAWPDARVLTADAATEAAWHDAGGLALAYIAAETDLNPSSPALNAFLLAGGGEHDGRLNALELWHGGPVAQTVVLNLNRRDAFTARDGREFEALAEGLVQAGATAHVVNRWNVPDDVRATFYGALLEAGPDTLPAEAYAAALSATRSAHPDAYAWAAFAYFGAW